MRDLRKTALLVAAWTAAVLCIAPAAFGQTSEEGQPASGKTLRAPLEVQRLSAPVPNSALGSIDPETAEIIEEKWRHLITTLNRSHRHEPLETPGIEASDIRPWTPPTDTAPEGGTNPLTLEVNGTPSMAAPSGFSSTVNEPSVAATDDYVFYTSNWFAASSTDGGTSWSFVNPFTGPFPEPAGQDFCCDQQAHYDPDTNSVFWLQQMIPSTSTDEGSQRVNVDQGANGTWDCFYDVTPQDAGFANDSFPDYPDFSISDQHLFVTSNIFPSGAGGFLGAFVARLPLADITSCSNTNVDFYTDTGFGSFRTTQGATDTMYFADHESTTSLRVWSWPQADAAPTFTSVTVNAWGNGTRTCPGPDNRDWCGFIDSRLFGAAVGGDRVAFFWSPDENPGGGFPFPYSQGVVLDASNSMAVLDQPLIWSNDAAWVYPSLASNSNGDFGGTVMWGGGTFFPSCSAFLADDENGDSFMPFEHEVVFAGTTGPQSNRSGDYLSTRVYSPNDRVYAGSCFAYPEAGRGEAHYALFGRADDFTDTPVFFDGFESGNVSAWSASMP